jgi:protein-disulfide isomerase
MADWRRLAFCSLILLNCKVLGCRSPNQGAGGASSTQEAAAVEVTLPGVDTSALTPRELRQWSSHVSELSAPCAEVKAPIVQCVNESLKCVECRPAARYLAGLVQKGLTPSQVEVAYRGRFGSDTVRDIDIAGSPRKGAEAGGVVLVEFADFECPACQAAAPVVEKVVSKHLEHVTFVFKNFPLKAHPNAEVAARAVVAAGQQGKFWELHHAVFRHGRPLDRAVIDGLAKGIGLDMARFSADIESEAVADNVNRDRKQGEALSISGTPTIFINGRKFTAADAFERDLEDWVALEIELLKARAEAEAKAQQAADKPSQPTGEVAPPSPGP